MTEPRPAATWAQKAIFALLSFAGSALAGAALAVILHYVLYRIGLPSEPFIYVAF